MLRVLATIVVVALTYSSDMSTIYQVETLNNLKCLPGYQIVATEFSSEVAKVFETIRGEEFSEERLILETKRVVEKYNNGKLYGKLTIQTVEKDGKGWKNLVSFYLYQGEKK